MHEKGLSFLQKSTKSLKQAIWKIVKGTGGGVEVPDDFEIHIKEITGGLKHYKELKDKNGVINEVNLIKILDLVYYSVSRLYSTIVAVVIPKKSFYKIYKEGLREWAFRLIVEKLANHVRENQVFPDENVSLIMDSAGDKEDLKRMKEIVKYKIWGTGGGYPPDNVIETPFIVNSHIHNGVQLADAVAFLLRRHALKCYEISPNAYLSKNYDDYMKMLYDLFNSGFIKIFPVDYNAPDLLVKPD